MSKLCLVRSNLAEDQTFMNSFRTDCSVHISEIPEFTDFSNITHLALFYHFPGYYQVPFYKGIQDTYEYFNKELVEKIKEVRDGRTDKVSPLIIDLVSCNLNSSDFASEVAQLETDLGISVRYSIDKTGNNPNGNWVMESDNTNIKDIYFTAAIDNWNHVLTSGLDIDTDTLFASSPFSRNTETKTVTVTASFTWQAETTVTNYINMIPDWTFDGNDKVITINNAVVSSFDGLFAVDSTAAASSTPTIKNFEVKKHASNDLTLDQAGGFIVRQSQKYFILDNCTTNSNLVLSNSYCGGMCGYASGTGGGKCIIKNCTNNIEVTNIGSGGIIGSGAGRLSGVCAIYNCTNTATISGGGGGIVGGGKYQGESYGAAYYGKCTIVNCTNSGEIAGAGAGGILGQYAGNRGLCSVNYCTNTGQLTGGSVGGIAGSYFGYYGEAYASNCTNTGTFGTSGNGKGGIIGHAIAYNRGTAVVNNCTNTTNIAANHSGGIVGQGLANTSTPVNNITVKNCYTTGDIPNESRGGIFGSYMSGDITVDGCVYKGQIQHAKAAGIFGYSPGYNSNHSNRRTFIHVKNCAIINTSTSGISRPAIYYNGLTSNRYINTLVSNSYAYDCEKGFFHIDMSAANSTNNHAVITNCYTNENTICTAESGSENENIVIKNSYSGSGTGGASAKYGDSETTTYTGNYDISTITDSSSFDSSVLNNQIDLDDILGFTNFSSDIWRNGDMFPSQSANQYTYDDGIILSNFQTNPWLSGTYSGATDQPTLNTISSSDNFAQPTSVISSTTAHSIGSSTFSVGKILTSIFSTQGELDDWFNGVGNNPSSVNDMAISGDYAILQSSDYPESGSKSFVTEKHGVIILEDGGNKTYNFSGELGNIYDITYGDNSYTLKFILHGSGGFEIGGSGGVGESGGDPHITSIMRPRRMLTLPNIHGSCYQYLTYQNGSEKLVINLMTWMMILSQQNPKEILSPNVAKFIKSNHTYLRYALFTYTNGDKIERVCYDLHNMQTVNSRVNNFDHLAYWCKLPIKKGGTDHIQISKKYLSDNERILKYRTNKTEQVDVTIYTKAAKFSFVLGNAKENKVFNTYIKLKDYPESLKKKGAGLLLDYVNYQPIKSLKSENRQILN